MTQLEKWAGICREFNTVLEALEHLQAGGHVRCEHTTKSALYEFFEIDPQELDRERRQLLEQFTQATNTKEAGS